MGLFDDLLEEEDKIQPTKRRGLFDDLLEEEDLVSPTAPPRTTAPQAQLLPPIEEMFKPKPREVGTFEGIANAARNAFASSQQALAVTGGVTPEEAKEISKIEFEKNARQVSPDYKEYQEAQGFDAVKAFARNPFEVTTNIVAEGLAGSLPALGAGLAAGGVGAAVAAPTVVGAPVGFLAGQVAGTFAGSLATEYGSKVLEELQGAGMDINNPDSITDFFSRQELVDAAKDKALKRGVPIAAFDALSAGIGGKVGAITKAAFKTKPREAVAEMAVQAALGGGGEVVGSLAAGDKIDPKAVFAEVVGEVGPGAAEIGVGKIQQTFAERRKQEQIKRAAKVSQDLENNNAPLTADALKTTVAKNIVEQEKQTADKLDEDLAGEVEKVSGMQPIREEEAFVMPPKEEFKASYAKLTPESLAETEASFQEQLQDEDADTRAFAQTALEALAEFKAEQTPVPTAATTPTPAEAPLEQRPIATETGAQMYQAEAIKQALANRQPIGADAIEFFARDPRTWGIEIPRDYIKQGNVYVPSPAVEAPAAVVPPPEAEVAAPPAEAAPPVAVEPTAVAPAPPIEPTPAEPTPAPPVEPAPVAPAEVETAASLSRVADNTATDEEVVRLARQGLVNIQDGQNVITPRGEEVMQRGGAPLPRLTPEERAAEVAAVPAIVEQAPTPTQAPTPVTTPTVTEAVTPTPAAPTTEAAAQPSPTISQGSLTTGKTGALLEPPAMATDAGSRSAPASQIYQGEDAIDKAVGGTPHIAIGYHGGKKEIDVVDPTKFSGRSGEGWLGIGFYSAPAEDTAASYGPKVTKVKITLKNPFVFPENTNPIKYVNEQGGPAKFTEKLKEQGYDGVISKNVIRQIVAFYPESVSTKLEATTPAAPAEAAPVGIAVGNRVKTKTTPQSFVVEEVLPQSAREAELGEQYYSIRNERTGETQVVESNDISPIKGKRTRKISPVRAEEKYTPVPEADRYTFREASGRAIRFFGGEKPENFVIVNNSDDPDYEFKAGYDPETGEIILNRAYIQRGENIEDILTHELGHYIYSDPQFQADFQDFLESMPDEARAEIDEIVNEGYNKETNEVQIEEREVMAFTSLIRRTKRGLTAWEKLKDTIKKIINRFLGTNITLSDQGAMAVFNVGYKRFKSGERIIREMKEGTLRTAPEGMTQMDRDYLAAVERGDMETAQRMVDGAAKKAGYTIDSYHGTNGDLFTVFSTEQGGDKTFAESARLGIFSTDNPDVAQTYAENIGFGGTFALGLGQGPLAEARDKAIARPEFQPLKKAKDAAEKEYSAAHKQLYDKYFELQKSQLQAAKDAFRSMLQNKTEAEVDQFIEEVAAKGAIQLFADDEAVNKNPQLIAAQEKINEATKAINDYIYPFLVEALPNVRVMQLKLQIKNPKIYDAKGQTPADFSLSDKIQQAKDLGHDGVIFENIIDPQLPATHYVVFEPQQIKSSDPVTYDDAGNVIPLSQRFRPTSPDIRRMAPEPAPALEAVVEEAPAERPKRRTKMQNIIDISTGVKRPKTKLTVNEMTALKDQIRMGARKRKEDKQTQREFAKDVTQYLRDMTIRGKVSAPQLRAITSKAMQTQFDNEASIKSFLNYANRVIENANYDKDVAEAKKTLKRARQLSKQKEGAANIKSKLAGVLDIDPRDIELDDMTERDVEVDGEIVRKKPISIAEFTAVLKEYMKALGPVTAEGYIVVPDQEFTDFVQTVRDQIGTNKAATDTIGMDGELAAIADKTAEQIDAELEADEERKNRIEQKVNKLAEDAQIALVKYDNPDLTDKEKEILDLLKRITLQDISIGNRKAYIQVANNILVNNKFFGAEKLSSIAAGQIGAAEAAKDSKQVKRNSASLNFLRTLFGENIPGSLLKFENLVNMSGQSFADAFRNFAGKQNMARFLYQIGFGKIEMGQAQANRERREITDNIQARFQQIEEQTKQKISDKQGIMSMGVASHLIQSTPDETEAEALTRMRNLIKQDIEKKKNAPDIEDRKDAAYIEKGLKEVDSDTVQGVLDNLRRLHPANYEALIFLKDEVLPEYKPLLKEHDELFNNQTDNYTNPNYLPIRYRAFTRALQKKEDIERRDNVGVTAPKQSPNSIKRVKNTVIPKDRQFDYNITKNVLDSLSIGLEAARTNAGWEQVNAFLESPNAEAAFDGPENLQFFKDRLSSVRRARLRKVYKMDGWDRLADVFANFIRTVGGGMVLGGFGQALKQYPAQFATTIANVNDLSITNQALVDIKAATPLMQMFSIGERGEIAGGSKWANQLEGNFSKLEQYMNEGAIPKIKSAFEKFNDIWLLALKKSDTAAAAHGWISYYRKYLKDNNIPFTSWDNEVALAQNNDKDRVQAGLYADQMIDLYQGSSDPTKMAVFAQRGDSGGGNLLKAMIIPFSSFVIQERSRYMSDIRDLSYGDTQERKDAIKGLIATTAGILLFHTVRRYALPLLTGGLATGVYALLGVDMEEPDEEEKKKQEDKVFRQFLGEIAANILVGGYSSMAENALIDTVNRMAYFHDIYTESDNVLNDDGEVMKFETYRKERAPMYRYTGPGADSALGMVDILPSQLSDNLDKLMDLADEELMDSLSVEEQMVLILAAFSETIYTFRLNDADVDRMFSRMSKEVKEQAEDRARAQRALQRIYGQ